MERRASPLIWFKYAEMRITEDGVYHITVHYFGRTDEDLQDDRRVTYTFKKNIKGKGIPPFLKDYLLPSVDAMRAIEEDRMFLSKKFWTANVLYSNSDPM